MRRIIFLEEKYPSLNLRRSVFKIFIKHLLEISFEKSSDIKISAIQILFLTSYLTGEENTYF